MFDVQAGSNLIGETKRNTLKSCQLALDYYTRSRMRLRVLPALLKSGAYLGTFRSFRGIRFFGVWTPCIPKYSSSIFQIPASSDHDSAVISSFGIVLDEV